MNYFGACLKQRQNFTPFVILLDGFCGVKVEAKMKRIASRLAKNWKELYSQTCGYMKSSFAITLVRADHRCI